MIEKDNVFYENKNGEEIPVVIGDFGYGDIIITWLGSEFGDPHDLFFINSEKKYKVGEQIQCKDDEEFIKTMKPDVIFRFNNVESINVFISHLERMRSYLEKNK